MAFSTVSAKRKMPRMLKGARIMRADGKLQDAQKVHAKFEREEGLLSEKCVQAEANMTAAGKGWRCWSLETPLNDPIFLSLALQSS